MLAVLLAVAASLLAYFYNSDEWREDVLRWAWEERHYAFFQHVAEGQWGGLTWQQWTTVGYAAVAASASLWLLLAMSAAWNIRAVPGMQRIVKEQQAEGWGFWQVLGVIAIIPIVIILFAAFAAAAAGAGSNDDDDED